MRAIRSTRGWYLVQGEVQHRWPSLPMQVLSGVRTPDALAALLSKQMGFSSNLALREANGFWADLEERFRRAA